MSQTAAGTARVRDEPASDKLTVHHALNPRPIPSTLTDEPETDLDPGRDVDAKGVADDGGRMPSLTRIGTNAVRVTGKAAKAAFRTAAAAMDGDVDDEELHDSKLGAISSKASKAGKHAPKLAGKGARATRGTVRVTGKAASSAKSMFAKAAAARAKRGVAQVAAKETHAIASTSMRLTATVARAVSAVAAKLAALAASVASVPVMVVAAVCAAVIALVTMVTSFLPMFHDGAEERARGAVMGVPAEYDADVIRAGGICPLVTGPVIAAQIEAESNWSPSATSPVGATGIAQFMPATWSGAGKDGDGDGKADIHNSHDQIFSQGHYMCALADSVQNDLKAGRLTGDPLQLTLAAYNAGLGNVQHYRRIPPFEETQNYVTKIIANAARYERTDGEDIESEGGEAGELEPKMKMQADKYHVDLNAMGISSADTTYQAFQCTWWAATRRAHIGKPVDGHMGNGGQWDDTARRLGMKTGKSARAGDVIVFELGVLGADGTYGHVGVVEQVKDNGDILISESSRGWMAVATRTITAAQLKANSAGVTFIH